MNSIKLKFLFTVLSTLVITSCTSYQKYKINDSIKNKQYSNTVEITEDIKLNKNNNQELVVASMYSENTIRNQLVRDIKLLFKNKKFNEAQILINKYKNYDFFINRAADLQIELDELLNNSKNDFPDKFQDSRLITSEFKNLPITAVIELLKKDYLINIVLDQNVKTDTLINTNVKKMPLDKFLNIVLVSAGLRSKLINKNTILIYSDTPEKRKQFEELFVKKFRLSYMESKNAINLINLFIPNIKEPFIDERSNTITYKDTAERLKLIGSLIAQHDIHDGEVLLDIQIIEIKKSRLTEVGINFPNSATIGPSKDNTWIGLTQSPLYNLNTGLLSLNMGNLLINLRREVGDFNVLANPSLRVKNKEKANIMVGDKVPVVSSTTSGTGTITNNINYLDVGIKLEAEPSINANSEILIKIGLEVSTLAKEIRTTTGDLAYQIGSRNANTVLRLNDGETQVLGGLISNEDRSSSNRIPGLGDLPILGRLFSSQKDDWQNTELVLAVTPHIIHNNSYSKKGSVIATGTETEPKLNYELDQYKIELNNTNDENLDLNSNKNETNNNIAKNKNNNLYFKYNLKNSPSNVLEVNFDGVSGLSAASFELHHNINNINITSISNGDLFDLTDNNSNFIYSNNKNGILTFGFNKSNAVLSKNSGNLVKIVYETKNTDEKPFEIKNASFLNNTGLVNFNKFSLNE